MMISCGHLVASGENSIAIAARLNRTPAGVRKRAKNLGVRLAGSARIEGEEVRRLMLSEIPCWLRGAGAVLVVLGCWL